MIYQSFPIVQLFIVPSNAHIACKSKASLILNAMAEMVL